MSHAILISLVKRATKTIMKPTQTMKEFFSRNDVAEQIEIQKRNPYGSSAHRNADNELRRLAKGVGADSYFPKY